CLPQIAQAPERLPIALDLLARYGLSRAQMAAASPQRDALLRDHAAALRRALDAALADATLGSLHQRVRVRLDRRLVRDRASARGPLARLELNRPPSRWTYLWIAWREARALAVEAASRAEDRAHRP